MQDEAESEKAESSDDQAMRDTNPNEESDWLTYFNFASNNTLVVETYPKYRRSKQM